MIMLGAGIPNTILGSLQSIDCAIEAVTYEHCSLNWEYSQGCHGALIRQGVKCMYACTGCIH